MIKIAGMKQRSGLLFYGCGDLRVAVPKADDTYTGQKIDVLSPFGVPQAQFPAAYECHGKARVCVRESSLG